MYHVGCDKQLAKMVYFNTSFPIVLFNYQYSQLKLEFHY